MASNGPKRNIPFPVFSSPLLPRMEAPIAKFGATIKVDKTMIIEKPFPSKGSCNSCEVIDAIGPTALATLFAPIEKATYSDITMIIVFTAGCFDNCP